MRPWKQIFPRKTQSAVSIWKGKVATITKTFFSQIINFSTMAAQVPMLTFNNGNKIPSLGLGTWKVIIFRILLSLFWCIVCLADTGMFHVFYFNYLSLFIHILHNNRQYLRQSTYCKLLNCYTIYTVVNYF